MGNSVVMLLPLRKIAIIAVSLLIADAAVLTKTLTRTFKTYHATTLTVKEFTHAVCASFVNATTACRRRRQALLEMPMIIAVDPADTVPVDLEESSKILNPTSVLPLVFPIPVDQSNLSAKNHIHNDWCNDYFDRLEETRRPDLLQYVHPYVLQSSQSGPYDYRRVTAPFQLSQFANYFNLSWTQKYFTSVTVTQLINYVKTVTETNTTKTFIVKNCVPPNFSFSKCLTIGF